MAFLRKNPRSPFWQLKYKDVDGKWVEKSTKYRHGVGTETREARKVCARHTEREQSMGPRSERWASWVPEFLASRYEEDSASLRNSIKAWKALNQFFVTKAIETPAQVKREHCYEFFAWRTRTKGVSGRSKPAGHNTARLELKYLSILCDEALEREYMLRNPAHKLGIPKHAPKVERPEMDDDFIRKVWAALLADKAPEWMELSFQIALHFGCRISETAPLCSDVNLEADEIHFRGVKNGEDFTAPIPAAIKPLLAQLVARKGQHIFELPASAPRIWHRFFKKTGLKKELAGVSFHSTRVTVVSRMAKNPNVKSDMARAAVNHSSELVHRQYQRWRPRDVADALSSLQIPAPGSGSGSSENQDAPSAT